MDISSPLPGKVLPQYIRCGKACCHCGRGPQHGPYYYRVWREGVNIRKTYIKQADIDAVRARCEAYQAIQDRLRQVREEQAALARSIAHECRTAKRLLRTKTF